MGEMMEAGYQSIGWSLQRAAHLATGRITMTPDTTRSARVSNEAWWSELGAVAGRRLFESEIETAKTVAGDGKNLRVVANMLFGQKHVDAYYNTESPPDRRPLTHSEMAEWAKFRELMGRGGA